jgi:hypothetical protein
MTTSRTSSRSLNTQTARDVLIWQKCQESEGAKSRLYGGVGTVTREFSSKAVWMHSKNELDSFPGGHSVERGKVLPFHWKNIHQQRIGNLNKEVIETPLSDISEIGLTLLTGQPFSSTQSLAAQL